MKKIISIVILAVVLSMTGIGSAAQGRNSLRIGAGVNLHTPKTFTGHSSVGQSIFAEYGREINRYLSAAANLHTDLTYVNPRWNGHDIGLGLKVLVVPFASVGWLDWLEIGAGLSCDCRIDTRENGVYPYPVEDNGEEVTYYHMDQFRDFLFGFDFPIRAYIIDSARFELFAFFEIKTAFFDRSFGVNHYDAGLMFGVKF